MRNIAGVKLTPARIAIGLAVLFLFLLAAAFGVHEWRKANGMREQMRFAAYDVSKSFVRQVLVSHDSARFPEFHQDSDAVSTKRDDGEYATAGWVEIHDNGGTLHRMPWRCVVQPVNATNWKLTALRVGDQTLRGSFPEGQ